MYNRIIDNLCNNNKNIKGFENLINIVNKNVLIQIVGDIDTGKSTLAMDIVKKNQDRTFIYIDTFYNIQSAPDNCFMLLTNRFNIIEYMLNAVDKDVCDFLIIDSYNNLLDENESWDDDTFVYMTNMLKTIIQICYSKNISIILINSLNGFEKPFNYNNFLKLNSQYILQTMKYDYVNKIIHIKPIRALIDNDDYIYRLK